MKILHLCAFFKISVLNVVGYLNDAVLYSNRSLRSKLTDFTTLIHHQVSRPTPKLNCTLRISKSSQYYKSLKDGCSVIPVLELSGYARHELVTIFTGLPGPPYSASSTLSISDPEFSHHFHHDPHSLLHTIIKY
ncbi:hypothetical protein TNCV_4182971 [Trichonephila clavipes]|nr:hypothetical protein TNCV_4182971 [Trichonephila clavipes]